MTNKKRKALQIFCLIAFVFMAGYFLYNTQKINQSCTKEIFAMDTVMQLTAYGKNGKPAIEAAVQEIQRLDELLSTENPKSEIYRINQEKSGNISKDTASILKKAIETGRMTDGLFDVRIYPLMKLWGFPSRNYHVPTEKELQTALSQIHAEDLRLTETTLTIQDGQEIDLGGIAKGYASARIMEIFRQYDVSSGIVTLGGNVQALGTKPDGSPWNIGIKDPISSQQAMVGSVLISNQAVVTSGGYERYFEENGQSYSHILNPKTGYPADHELASVTVICLDGMTADALSTALFLMGKEKATAFWKQHKQEFDMVLITKEHAIYVTDGIQKQWKFSEFYADKTSILK